MFESLWIFFSVGKVAYKNLNKIQTLEISNNLWSLGLSVSRADNILLSVQSFCIHYSFKEFKINICIRKSFYWNGTKSTYALSFAIFPLGSKMNNKWPTRCRTYLRT